jgi:hypothetical protein
MDSRGKQGINPLLQKTGVPLAEKYLLPLDRAMPEHYTAPGRPTC